MYRAQAAERPDQASWITSEGRRAPEGFRVEAGARTCVVALSDGASIIGHAWCGHPQQPSSTRRHVFTIVRRDGLNRWSLLPGY